MTRAKRRRRSLVALVGAIPLAAAWAGGCANVSGLSGLSLDPQCTASCASDGSAAPEDAGPKPGSDASDVATTAIDTGSGATMDGAAARDTGTDTSMDGSVPPGEIRCATGDACTAGPEECCMNNASPPALSCASSTSAQRCPNGTELKCDDPSDCSGDACCLQLNSSGYILQTACQSGCSGTGWYELCAAGGTCRTGSCNELSVLPAPPFTAPWFYACQ